MSKNIYLKASNNRVIWKITVIDKKNGFYSTSNIIIT